MSLPEVCVCYLTRTGPSGATEVLLGRKRAGLGRGRMVGPGGKIEPGETPSEAIAREIAEETGIRVRPFALRLVGELVYPFPFRPSWSQKSWVFLCDEFEGEASATDELIPGWFRIDEIPLDEMWDDARYWLHEALAGGYVTATFEFGGDLATVSDSDHPGWRRQAIAAAKGR